MADEPHAVVQLLLKRMESHPEEFAPDGEGRWAQWLDELIPFVTEAERVLLRGPMMQSIHERVMDELVNGPERRAKEAEEQEYERNLAKSLRLTQQQAMQQQMQQQMQQYQNAVGQLGVYDVDRDMYRNAQTLGLSGRSPNSLPIANGSTGATLPKSAINQIKQALGIKK
jgi:hypothetical protein